MQPASARSRRHRYPALVVSCVVAAGGLAAVTVAGSAGAAVPAPAPAAPVAAPKAPVFSLVNTAPRITVRRPAGEPAFAYLTGPALVAGGKPVVFTATRASYAQPVVATMAVGTAKRSLPTALAGLDGLRKVVTVTVTDAAGRSVGTSTAGACPTGGSDGGRTRPDAPATSPYPTVCSAGPFALRTVYGVQAGWAAPLLVAPVIDGPDGVYTVTTTVTPAWRALFSMPVAKARTSTKVTVVTVAGEAAPTAAGHSHGPASTTGSATGSATGVPHTAWLATPEGRAATPLQRMRHADAAHAARVAQLAASSRPVATTPGAGGARRVATAAVAPALRPDLRSLPAYGISLVKGSELADMGEGVPPALRSHEFLTFGATTWNAGAGALVVEGFRRPNSAVMDAYQFFHAKGRQVSYTKVGTMEYDRKQGHEHWHFKDFAQYNLLDGRQRAKLRSGKEAWCLSPTDSVDLLQAGAVWKPESIGLGSACGAEDARSIREVLPSGWGDTYTQYLPGQSFDVTGLPNGTYYIEILANPDKRLIEVSTTNNRSLRKVVLSGPAGARKVTVPAYQLVDSEARPRP